MTKAAALCLVLPLALAACDREARHFVKLTTASNPRAQAAGMADLQPGQPGAGMRPAASAGGYDESSAYEISQGRTWFRWYNCNGCHSNGGGGMGPPLMDQDWIYGSEPDAIFATIIEGRPNGMPSFRGRIPEAQVWQIVAYVRSLSGLVDTQSAPNRTDWMASAPPESRREAKRADEKRK